MNKKKKKQQNYFIGFTANGKPKPIPKKVITIPLSIAIGSPIPYIYEIS